MADLAGGPAETVLDDAVDDDARGESGAEVEEHDGSFGVGSADHTRGADRGCIDVVLDVHGNTEALARFGTKLQRIDVEVDDVVDTTGFWIDLSGDADADRGDLIEQIAGHLMGDRYDVVDDLRVAASCGNAHVVANIILRIDENGLDLGAADVDADAEAVGRCLLCCILHCHVLCPYVTADMRGSHILDEYVGQGISSCLAPPMGLSVRASGGRRRKARKP